jgi:hypothetical protein
MRYKISKMTKWYILACVGIFAIGIFIVSSTDKVELFVSEGQSAQVVEVLMEEVATTTDLGVMATTTQE